MERKRKKRKGRAVGQLGKAGLTGSKWFNRRNTYKIGKRKDFPRLRKQCMNLDWIGNIFW